MLEVHYDVGIATLANGFLVTKSWLDDEGFYRCLHTACVDYTEVIATLNRIYKSKPEAAK